MRFIIYLLCLLILLPSYAVSDELFKLKGSLFGWVLIIMWLPYEYLIILPLGQFVENYGH